MSATPTAIFSLLERARTEAPQNGITFYAEAQVKSHRIVSYNDLYTTAKTNAKILLDTKIVTAGAVILLHLGTHVEYVEWFWSVVAAGGIPAVSTPLAVDPVARERHLRHLEKVLKRPKVLTNLKLSGDFSTVDSLDITFIEQLQAGTTPVRAAATVDPTSVARAKQYSDGVGNGHCNRHTNGHINGQTNRYANGATADPRPCDESEPAFLMLTSGSTGNAKAVECYAAQVNASLTSKSIALASTRADVFLNWIGFDHVACVTEIHMHAMSVGANQILVAPTVFLQDPSLFFKKLAQHSVTITFAPNFFIAAACKSFERMTQKDLDLSQLRHVVSGGEANVVSTCVRFGEALATMGAPSNIVRTAFGMTETLGASHYQLHFPSFEQQAGLQFCSVGQPINATKMRITDDDGNVLPTGQTGNLELFGPAIFKGYFNDLDNTRKSFTDDGWFKSGDNGYITETNHLILSGRAKDSLIINGVKYFSHELESALEGCHIPDLVPSYTAVFSTWPVGSDSEELVITILSTEVLEEDDNKFASLISEVSKQTVLYCSKRPIDIIPLPISLLPKSALGKLSRPKLKKYYEEGKFDQYKTSAKERLSIYRKASRQAPQSETEKILVELFADEFSLDKKEIGLDDSLTDMGVDSIRVIRFKNLVQDRLKPEEEVPLISLLQNPSIRGLSEILDGMREAPKEYNPVVQLQAGTSSAPPIFFFHPGLGEILVFLNLSKFFSDRQVYAMRAPGFNKGEEMFKSIDHMTDVYVERIREKQPEGPYVFIGYSFGAMIAFEVAKKMEASGSRVGFIGTLNLPPHIKFRMIELDWTELVLNLVYFLGFISEENAHAMSPEMHKLPRQEVLERIMAIASPERLRELDLNERKISHWAELSSKLQGLAHNYNPSGSVDNMDVFYAVPLIAVGRDKQKWLEDHLLAWGEFVRSPVKFHDVPGSHYTMMNLEHVFALQKALREAMKERGV